MTWVNGKQRFLSGLLLSSFFLLAFSTLFPSAAGAVSYTTTPQPYSSLGFTEFPYSLDIEGTAGEAVYTMTLPAGVELVRLTGDVESNYLIEGDLLLKINNETRMKIPAKEGGHIEIPLTLNDAVNNTVTITFTTDDAMRSSCIPDGSTASFRNGIMWYLPPKNAPASIREFMDDGIVNWIVHIPSSPTPAEQQAGLTAVSALSYSYPAPARVSLALSDEPSPHDNLTRIVIVKETPSAGLGSGGTVTVDDNGNMLMTGSSGILNNVVTILGNPTLRLVQGREITKVSGTTEWDPPAGAVTLKEMGVGNTSLVGAGTISKTIAVNQPFFAQPVESFTINITGSLTRIPDASVGRIETLWNGVLVDSQNMTSDMTTYSTSFTSTPKDTLRNNTLSIVMVYSPESIGCDSNTLPQRLDLDVANSTVTPTFGDSVPPGFERFPQTLDKVIPIVFGSEGTLEERLLSASNLVSALQALSPYQYTVTIIPYRTLVANDQQDGIVVGAGANATNDLQAPYAVSNSIRLVDGTSTFTAVIDSPFALAQSYSGLYRDLALFGPVPAGQDGTAQAEGNQKMVRLTQKAATSPFRWAVYTGQVVALLEPDGLVNVSLPARYEIPTIYPKTVLLLKVGGGVTVFLLICLLIWIFLRPKKKKMLPPEEEEDPSEIEDPEPKIDSGTTLKSPSSGSETGNIDAEKRTEEELAPSGYYPDPFNPRRVRLWLGNSWPVNEVSDTEEERQAILEGLVAPPDPHQRRP